MSTIRVTNLKHESSASNNIVLDSSGNLAVQAGSASTPAIQATGDSNTGIYFSAADTVDIATGGTQRAQLDSSGNLKFNSGYGSVATAYGVRAWVNFDGTGTVAIRGSGNVSSITDNGTGDYTVNFATAMPDANYSTVASTARDSSSYWDNLVSLYPVGQYSTAGVRIITAAMSAQQDRYYVTVAIFR